MSHFKMALKVVLALVVLALTGCGGSGGSGTGVDPFASNSPGASTGTRNTTIFGNISTAAGKTGITLSTDRASVDVNNGQVLVTARIANSGGGVAGVPITFSIVAPLNGPATIEPGLTTVTTDANGTAITRITTGNTSSTTNVIVSATASIGNQSATANTSFQIVRGTGVIAFSGIQPLSATVNPGLEGPKTFQQPIPITLTDSNGNPRVGAPVTLSVYTKSGSSSVVFSQPTVTTDASGTAIFNVTVSMPIPSPELSLVDSIIFKAATADAVPIVAYAAGYYAVTSSASALPDPNYKMTLTADKGTVGINSEVLLTATITDLQTPPKPLQNKSITFSIVAGPATIIDFTTNSDSVGKAFSRLKVGTTNSSSSIIVQAVTTVSGLQINAYTTIQVVRQNSMIINFITSKAPTDPDGTLNHLSTTLPWDTAALRYGFVQLVPFQVQDENGIPMPNVDVNVSVYSTQSATTLTLYPSPLVTTDDHGMGIFNISAMLDVPSLPGTSNSDAIVFLATASVNGQNLRSYGGLVISVAREPKPQ